MALADPGHQKWTLETVTRKPATSLPFNIKAARAPFKFGIPRIPPQNIDVIRTFVEIENWSLTGNCQPPCLRPQSLRDVPSHNQLLAGPIVRFRSTCPGMPHDAANAFAI